MIRVNLAKPWCDALRRDGTLPVEWLAVLSRPVAVSAVGTTVLNTIEASPEMWDALLVWGYRHRTVPLAFPDTVWVEVRAPRAVPAPETERVPWWEAVGRVVPDVGTIREVGMSGDQAWVRCGDYDPDGVAPDGTVEVLKDGDR